MTYRLRNLAPWGRNFDEYTHMFGLCDTELNGKIAGFADGPASFNAECCQQGGQVVSFDPVYRYPVEKLELCLQEAKRLMFEDICKNTPLDGSIAARNIDELEKHHMEATRTFLDDYEKGKTEGRYIDHELPFKIPFPDYSFDLGLSSHFLMLYPGLGINFHLQALEEMLRICHEIRVFPTVDKTGKPCGLTDRLIGHFCEDYKVTLKKTACHYMNGAHEMLVIGRKDVDTSPVLH